MRHCQPFSTMSSPCGSVTQWFMFGSTDPLSDPVLLLQVLVHQLHTVWQDGVVSQQIGYSGTFRPICAVEVDLYVTKCIYSFPDIAVFGCLCQLTSSVCALCANRWSTLWAVAVKWRPYLRNDLTDYGHWNLHSRFIQQAIKTKKRLWSLNNWNLEF